MKPLKTFEDLVFQKHAIAIEAEECLKKDKSLLPLSLYKKACNAKQAVMDFPNGYGISVVFRRNVLLKWYRYLRGSCNKRRETML